MASAPRMTSPVSRTRPTPSFGQNGAEQAPPAPEDARGLGVDIALRPPPASRHPPARRGTDRG
eukprot:scaffold49904_cov63-Phaeocystis_antarctica.AAC.3